MKKLLIMLISVFALGAATFAQNGHGKRGQNDRYESPSYKDGHNKSKDSYGDHKNARYDQGRQAEWDRINRDYDRRIDEYRNDRRMSKYDRDRRIHELERERQQKANSFGKGLVIGGVAGVLIGVLAGR